MAAAAAGVMVVAELGSGRMTKTTTTDPATMLVTLMRYSGTPTDLEMSEVKSATNCARAGVPSTSSVISLAIVILISAGGSNSLTVAVVSVEFCWPPDHAVPTPTTMLPACTTPFLKGRVQMMDESDTSTSGLHLLRPVPPMSSATTSVRLVPKFVPVMVTTAARPATTWAGSTFLIVGLGKLTWLAATLSFSKSPLLNRTMMSCERPTQGGVTHVRRVPAMSETTSDPHTLERAKSMVPLRLVWPM
mmetsp:Transcript_30624/g.59855  ORF Transcript_30624/g.59855 Transcript_30624/m.59855 type:complete len:247 (-) Transcript_30624:484-1224(-)